MTTATKTKETLKVDQVGEFGVRVGEKWYGISQYGDAELSDFAVGGTYEVELTHSKAGKAYIDSVLSSGAVDPTPVKKETAPAKKSYPKAKSTTAAKDWKGTTPEERKSSGHSQKVGGVQHDFATVFASLIAIGKDVEEAYAVAIEVNVRARKELEKKLAD